MEQKSRTDPAGVATDDMDLDTLLEHFGRRCEYFLDGAGRAEDDPRPGTLLYSWAVIHCESKVHAGLLLSLLAYAHGESKGAIPRLRASQIRGLRDSELNFYGASHLRRPYFLDYRSIYLCLGLSERQIIDGLWWLDFWDYIELLKVPGHRGPVVLLNERYHHRLAQAGVFEQDYNPSSYELSWRTWIHASEIIAMQNLKQAVVLARWLRWLEMRERQSLGSPRPNNTHGQIAMQLGLSERTVQRTMAKLYGAGVLQKSYVKMGKGLSIPSPIFGPAQAEQLRKRSVEALAKYYDLPAGVDLRVFWQNDYDASEDVEDIALPAEEEPPSEDAPFYEVAVLSGPTRRPPVRPRRRRRSEREISLGER